MFQEIVRIARSSPGRARRRFGRRSSTISSSVSHDDHLAVSAQAARAISRGRQHGEQPLDLRHRSPQRASPRSVSRIAGEVGPCSAWPEQIGRAESRASTRVVGDDQGLGRTGEQVDADPAEQLALGLRDKALPGPTSMSTGGIARCQAPSRRPPERRRGNRSRPRRPGAMRDDDRRRRLAVERRRAGDDRAARRRPWR